MLFGMDESLAPGQRVVITQLPLRGATGTIIRSVNVLSRTLWLVKIDGGPLGVGTVPFSRSGIALSGVEAPRHDVEALVPGHRVRIHTAPFTGSYGTLIRRSWWFWQPAWLVRLDGRGVGRTRIVERWLEPVKGDAGRS
jgi:hypothetical protein